MVITVNHHNQNFLCLTERQNNAMRTKTVAIKDCQVEEKKAASWDCFVFLHAAMQKRPHPALGA